MEHELVVLSLAVFGASALQSATGIGFGIIAGPVLLVVLNDSAAIQISVVLNLLIAVLLAPSLREKADSKMLKSLLTGLVVGSPLGLLIFISVDLSLLKAFAAIVILFTLIVMLRSSTLPSTVQSEHAGEKLKRVAIGGIAGAMGCSLAMPGPVPAAWMSAKGFDKETIRATVLVMFVLAYLFALLLQITFVGIDATTLRLCAILAPSTLAGILVGRILSSRLSEQVFRWILVATLLSTAIILLFTVR